MPDSGSTKTERGVQALFRKLSFFKDLLLAAAILAAHAWLVSVPNRSDRPPAAAPVRYAPVRLDAAGFAPLTFAGAWTVTVGDDRFGGVSALAIDQGRLLALTDSGTLLSLPKPGRPGSAFVRDLPGGPGSAGFKRNRDSEAIARDPGGRGWWVAVEQSHQLWLYGPDFRRALGRIGLGRERWRPNKGIEGMVPARGGLLVFPEGGDQELAAGSARVEARRLENGFGRLSDAAELPDGRILLVGRRLRIKGFENRLLMRGFIGRGIAIGQFAPLAMRRRDNVEAIAVEPHAGGTRLWLMTDNDFRPRAPTMLVALDLP
jgi:hypothetical protein